MDRYNFFTTVRLWQGKMKNNLDLGAAHFFCKGPSNSLGFAGLMVSVPELSNSDTAKSSHRQSWTNERGWVPKKWTCGQWNLNFLGFSSVTNYYFSSNCFHLKIQTLFLSHRPYEIGREPDLVNRPPFAEP